MKRLTFTPPAPAAMTFSNAAAAVRSSAFPVAYSAGALPGSVPPIGFYKDAEGYRCLGILPSHKASVAPDSRTGVPRPRP